MRALLGFAAASAAVIAFSPATAQSAGIAGFSSSRAFSARPVSPPPPGYPPGFLSGGDFRRHCRGEHCRHIRVGDDIPVAAGYGYGYGAGYYGYGDYDANRSFSPDKWNDWWHERPERAFPRWMSQNKNCERIWYSGAGWRC